MADRLLVFAEDPGAALFLQPLPAAWQGAGGTCRVLALPFAAPYFADCALIAPPAYRDDDAARKVIADERPSVLLVGTSENPDSFAFALAAAARDAGIPVIGAVDSAPNAAHRFRGRTGAALGHAPDHLMVADEATSRGFRALGMTAQRISVVGHPRLAELVAMRRALGEADRAMLRQRLFPGADPRPVIVFVSELSVGLGDDPFRKTADYALHGTSGSTRRSDIVAEELVRAARLLPDKPWLVLRLHPKQPADDAAAIAGLFDQVSQRESGLDVVLGANLVTGMTSILLAEAAVLGRPVLSIVPDPAERAWLGDLGDAIASVSNRPALEAALQAWPKPLPFAPGAPCPAAAMVDAIASVMGRSA